MINIYIYYNIINFINTQKLILFNPHTNINSKKYFHHFNIYMIILYYLILKL